MKSFEVGDKVMLRSGSDPMTVWKVELGIVHAVFFPRMHDGSYGHAELHVARPAECFERIVG